MNNDTKSAEQGHLNQLSFSRRTTALLTVFAVSVVLTACGGKGVIQTTDDSADYKSARALPPLKKSSEVAKQTTKPRTELVVETVTDEASAADSTVDAIANSEAVDNIDTDNAATENASAPQANTVEENAVAENDVAESAVEESAVDADQSTQPAQVSARVIDANQGKSRLEISTDFDSAWLYLSNSLKKSDVTVFSRNKTAGRFAIGCAGVAEDKVVTSRKGGWSFFKRDTDQEFEYCSLKVTGSRNATLISVLDRSGTEVAGENSASLFSRILNN